MTDTPNENSGESCSSCGGGMDDHYRWERRDEQGRRVVMFTCKHPDEPESRPLTADEQRALNDALRASVTPVSSAASDEGSQEDRERRAREARSWFPDSKPNLNMVGGGTWNDQQNERREDFILGMRAEANHHQEVHAHDQRKILELEMRLALADADSDYAGECDRLTAKNVALQTRLQKLEKAMRLISQEKCQTGLSDCGCVMCIARAALQGDPSV